MVNRVSTGGNYSAVLANLIAAQERQMDAGEKVASQKNGADLKDYARNAEMLTAMRAIESRLTTFSEQNKLVSDKLITQDFGLTQVADQGLAGMAGNTRREETGQFCEGNGRRNVGLLGSVVEAAAQHEGELGAQ